ncbi:MAG: MFS transporter [Oscillochloridaceae bacterium umkhey_bin13]
MQVAAPSLWQDRAFVTFWAARVIAQGGSTIAAVVLPILVFQLTGSALQTSLLATLEVLPYFAFGLVAGALADRFNRRRLMVGCTLLQAVLVGSIPLAAAFDMLSLTQIYAVALLSMTAFVWFDAANFGALPALAGRERIVEANSAIFGATTVVAIIAPALGGGLAALVGPANAITLNAVTFVVAAVLLALIKRSFGDIPPAPPGDAPLRRVWADIRDGLAFVWRQPLVRSMTIVGFGNSLSGGAVIGLLVVYAVRALGLGQTDGRIGLLYTASAVGGLAASLLLPPLARRLPVGWITLTGLVAHLAALVGIALAPGLSVGIAMLGVWQLANSLVIINGIAARQRVTPDHLQARVNMTARMLAWGGQPFGAALGGLLADLLDIRLALLIMASGVALSAWYGLRSPLRQRDLGGSG